MTLRPKTHSILVSLTVLIGAPALAQTHGHHDHSMDMTTADRSTHMVEAMAIVTATHPGKHRISLTHGPIPAVSWPAATMSFPLSETISLMDFKPGDRVQFTLHRTQNGGLPLVELCKTQSATVQPGLCASASHSMKMTDGMTGHDMGAMPIGRSNMGQTGMDHSQMSADQMNHEKMDHNIMGHGDRPHGDAASQSVSATGQILRIDSDARRLRIKHDPIPEIQWPVMTMDFEAGDGVDLSGLTMGATIDFDFDPSGEDGYIISAIRTSSLNPDHSGHDGH